MKSLTFVCLLGPPSLCIDLTAILVCKSQNKCIALGILILVIWNIWKGQISGLSLNFEKADIKKGKYRKHATSCLERAHLPVSGTLISDLPCFPSIL